VQGGGREQRRGRRGQGEVGAEVEVRWGASNCGEGGGRGGERAAACSTPWPVRAQGQAGRLKVVPHRRPEPGAGSSAAPLLHSHLWRWHEAVAVRGGVGRPLLPGHHDHERAGL